MVGQVVSDGIAIGQILRIEPYMPVGQVYDDHIEDSLELLNNSFDATVVTISKLIEKTARDVGEKEAEIFKAHKMIIEDPTLLPQVAEVITKDKLTAPSAIEQVMTAMEQMFLSLDSDYMKERALDIIDIKKRWVNTALGRFSDTSSYEEPVILVAEELTPSDTLEMDLKMVAGLLMEKGGVTSHTSILAQSMGIPAIVGCGVIEHKAGLMILDANDKKVIVNPSEDEINHYKERIKVQNKEKEELKTLIGQKSITQDGRRVEIAANIAGVKDLEDVSENDAEGVGLFRTEFVYMNRIQAPTEEEQFEIYKKVVSGLEGKPVIFRTMDIGGDKEVPYLNMPKEYNPFLGYRAIRYCLDEIEFFKTQLRAIYRASAFGSVKIMFPMIGNVKEFKKAKSIAIDVKEELESQGIKCGNVPLGIMVEIPSAAIQAEQLAKHVDFFSIGTNDLTQYTLAVDRQNEQISDLYTYFDPAVLNLIKHVIEVGKKTDTWVGMCGSAAGDMTMIPLLLHWGIDEISMPASLILKARYMVRSLTGQNTTFYDEIFDLDDGHAVKAFLTK